MRRNLCIMMLMAASLAHAQKKDSIAEKKKGFIVLPAVFFAPETSLGFGGACLVYFRPKNQLRGGYKPSNLQNIFIYTLENQILFKNEYNIYLKKGKYWLIGELGYYIYPYEFYGIGSNTSINPDSAELYTANYLKTENNGLIRIKEKLYVGPSIFMDQYFRIDTKTNGMLESENIRGVVPQRLFGFGVSFVLDHRNNNFSPYQGYYLEGRVLRYEDNWIGDFPFTDMYIDARKYFYLNDTWETGMQFYHQSVIGKPPFYSYALLGGSKLMRGYYKGAYRDHHQTVLQAEVRRYLSKAFILAAFGGVGSVSDTFGVYERLLGSYGLGLRFELNAREHIRIRLDYARGYQTDGFYININEAF